MANELWYPIYDNTSKDVVGAGFYVEPENVGVGDGRTLGTGREGEIPNPLKDGDTFLYAYNTETNLVEAKA